MSFFPLNQNVLRLFIIAALTLFAFFFGLDAFGLLNNNDGLYAQIAREMLDSGNWVIPHLNDAPYIEKPPLLYWLIALSYSLFGISEFSARLVPALSGFLLCLSCTVFLQKLRYRKSVEITPLVFISCMGFILFSRMIFFDVLFTLLFSLSIMFFYLWWLFAQKISLRLSYIFLAFAVLTKGLLAIILAGTIVGLFFLAFLRNSERFFAFLDPIGLLLFCCIAIPWHILAHQQDPDFLHFYFVNEHFYRFLDMREPRDYYRGPVYYYVHRLLLYLMPLTLLGVLFRKRITIEKSLFSFLLIWFITIFIFFSMSKAKANYYIVAAFPPLLIMASIYIHEIWEEVRLTASIRIITRGLYGVLIIGCLCVLGRDLELLSPISPYIMKIPHSFIWIMLMTILFCLILSFSRLLFTSYKLIFFASPVLLVIVASSVVMKEFESDQSAKPIMLDFNALETDSPLYSFHDFEKISSARFYTDHPIIIVESQSNDLLYGQNKNHKKHLFLSINDFRGLNEPRIILVTKEHLSEFKSLFPNAELLNQKGKHILFRVNAYTNQD